MQTQKSTSVFSKKQYFRIIGIIALVISTSVNGDTFIYEDTVSGALNNQTSCVNPDGGSNGATNIANLVRTIPVTNSFIINDLNLGFRASHTWRGDIDIILVSPVGTTLQVTITDTTGTGAEDNFDLAFDDESALVYDDNNNDNTDAPNYAADRSAAPSNPLSIFDGENANGNWILRMCDKYATSDDGNYLSAELLFDGDPIADLAITKTASTATYTPNVAFSYTLEVTNNGPENLAGGIVVNDNLPNGLALTGPVTCVATGAATCGGTGSYGTLGGTGFSDTDAAINAGVGNMLTYTLNVLPSTNMTDY